MAVKSNTGRDQWVDLGITPEIPWRTLIRERAYTSAEGLVAEDIDLVVLRYGPLIDRPKDADGEFMLCEFKHENTEIGYAQRRTFNLIHQILRKGDPEGRHYKGSYSVHWFDDRALVNHKPLTHDEFIEWINGAIDLATYLSDLEI